MSEPLRSCQWWNATQSQRSGSFQSRYRAHFQPAQARRELGWGWLNFPLFLGPRIVRNALFIHIHRARRRKDNDRLTNSTKVSSPVRSDNRANSKIMVPATAVLLALYVTLFRGLVNWELTATLVVKLISDAGSPLGVSNWTFNLLPRMFAWVRRASTLVWL